MADLGSTLINGDLNVSGHIKPSMFSGPSVFLGIAGSKPIIVSEIVGSDGYGNIGDLYLQYGANSRLMLGDTGAYNISVDGSQYSGNSASATKLATARTISLTSKVTGSASFNGTANISISTTVANNSHTHTKSNITDFPTSLPANGGNATTLAGQAASIYRRGRHGNGKRFTVDGNADTYYPVMISGSAQYGFNRYSITRGYSWAAPSTWNNRTHKGGLTFTWETSGDTGWGGNDHAYRVVQFAESYCTMVAGMVLTVSGMVVWLRGGGALYELQNEAGVDATATVYLGTYTSGDSKAWPVRTNTSSNTSEIFSRYPIRGNGDKVYGAVYNDYAEYRQSKENIKAGFVAIETGDGTIKLCNKRLSKAPMIVSDCFGFAIGQQFIEGEHSLPIAVLGRVLAYTDKSKLKFKVGDVVCSGLNGTVSKMKKWEKILFPDRAIGYVSEIPKYKTWGTDDINVNGRIWIKLL